MIHPGRVAAAKLYIVNKLGKKRTGHSSEKNNSIAKTQSIIINTEFFFKLMISNNEKKN